MLKDITDKELSFLLVVVSNYEIHSDVLYKYRESAWDKLLKEQEARLEAKRNTDVQQTAGV